MQGLLSVSTGGEAGSEPDMVQLHMASPRNGPTASRRGMASDLGVRPRLRVLRRRRNDGNTTLPQCLRKQGHLDLLPPRRRGTKWPIMTRPTPY